MERLLTTIMPKHNIMKRVKPTSLNLPANGPILLRPKTTMLTMAIIAIKIDRGCFFSFSFCEIVICSSPSKFLKNYKIILPYCQKYNANICKNFQKDSTESR
jgi:hypothetical protein